jgi:hypothetical protein
MRNPRPLGQRELRLIELFTNCRVEMTPWDFYSKWGVTYALEFRLRHSDSAALSGVQAEKYSLRLGQRPVSWENKSAEKFEHQGQSVTQYRRPWTEDEISTTKSQLPLCQLLPNSELSVKLHTIT